MSDDGVRFIHDNTPVADAGDPDVLTLMGREVRDSILRHPEKYEQVVMGTKIFVVDDPAYDSLFYLFSGKTRQALHDEENQVAALLLRSTPVLSHRLYIEARRREQGWS